MKPFIKFNHTFTTVSANLYPSTITPLCEDSTMVEVQIIYGSAEGITTNGYRFYVEFYNNGYDDDEVSYYIAESLFEAFEDKPYTLCMDASDTDDIKMIEADVETLTDEIMAAIEAMRVLDQRTKETKQRR